MTSSTLPIAPPRSDNLRSDAASRAEFFTLIASQQPAVRCG